MSQLVFNPIGPPFDLLNPPPTPETDPDFAAWLATNPIPDLSPYWKSDGTSVATGSWNLGAYNITAANLAISNWNTAYGWGNHASAGYLTAATNIWKRTGTVLAPQTAGDSLNMGAGSITTTSNLIVGDGATSGYITANSLYSTAYIGSSGYAGWFMNKSYNNVAYICDSGAYFRGGNFYVDYNSNLFSASATLSNLTAGRIPFASATKQLTDSANLFWDATNSRLGVGTTSPVNLLQIQKDQSAFTAIYITNASIGSLARTGVLLGEDTTTKTVGFTYQNNSYTPPGGYELLGSNRASFYAGQGATGGISIFAGANDANSAIIFGTGGFATANERMRITNAGNVGIGTTSPGVKFDVVGTHVTGLGIARFKGDGAYGFMTTDTTLTASGTISGFLLAIGGVKKGHIDFLTNPDTTIGGTEIFGANDFANPKILLNDAGNIILARASGNVGIGTAAPSTRFHLAGSTSAHYAQIDTGVNFKTVAKPASAPTATLAGVVGLITTGDHRYAVSFVTPLGETSLSDRTGIISTVEASNGQVNLTNIPVSTDYRVTKRRIYRTIVGSAAYSDYYFKFLYEIPDNTTTTYTDNKADGSLTGGASGYPGYYYLANSTNSFVLVDGVSAMVLNNLNTAFGAGAGSSLVSGSYSNTFFGTNAGHGSTSGSLNTLIGETAGSGITTGNSNTLIGAEAAYASNGSSNIVIGTYAGYSLSSGSQNVLLGTAAGFNNNGTGNVFLGHSTGYYETATSNTLYIDNQNRGSIALSHNKALIYGVFDTATANQRLYINGKVGIGLGQDSFTANRQLDISGDINFTPVTPPVVAGMTLTEDAGAGYTLLNGTYWYSIAYTTADGDTSAVTDAGTNAVSITTVAKARILLANIPVSTDTRVTTKKIYRCQRNQANGQYVQYLVTSIANATTTYTDNVADASLTLTDIDYRKDNTTVKGIYYGNTIALRLGTWNVTIGVGAGGNLTTGSENWLIGKIAGGTITTGTNNHAMGNGALYGVTTGQHNIGFGYAAGQYNNTGNFNISLGQNTGRMLSLGAVTGNTAIGDYALFDQVAGNNYNSAFGYQAGLGFRGKNNVLIGNQTGLKSPSTAVGDYNIFIGDTTGQNATTGANNNILIGKALSLGTAGGVDQLNIGGLIKGIMTVGSKSLDFDTASVVTTGTMTAGSYSVGATAGIDATVTYVDTLLGPRTLTFTKGILTSIV